MRLGVQAQQVQPLALQDLQVPSNEARDLPMENDALIGILWIFVVIYWDFMDFCCDLLGFIGIFHGGL